MRGKTRIALRVIALASAITAFLSSPRRAARRTDRVLGAEFGPAAVAAKFADIYRRVAATACPGSAP